MPLADLIRKEFGIKTRAIENPILASLDATPRIVLANNPNRLFWLVVNLGVNPAFLALTREVSPGRGACLAANGGYASMEWRVHFDATGWAIWGRTSIGESPIYSLEIVEV